MPNTVDGTRRSDAPVLIAGPTASGKSRLALDLAEAIDGVIINADSMQVYAGLRVLTAGPSPGDEARAPHRLYGHVAAERRYSVGQWIADVSVALAEAARRRLRPIVVGGTGLYFRALTEGLSPIPPVDEAIREQWRERSRREAPESLHRRLAELSPEDAARLRPTDRHRIVRALEVRSSTGRSLAAWQRETADPLLRPGEAARIVLDVDRDWLDARMRQRAEVMLREGAVAEVASLVARRLDPSLPVMKAIGVGPIRDLIAGRLSYDEAVAACALETRRYAKRQVTWFRHQMGDWWRLAVPPNATGADEIVRLIDRRLSGGRQGAAGLGSGQR